MATYVNESYSDFITVVDSSNNPVTAATFTAEVIRDPSGNPFSYTIDNLGSGSYEVRFIPSLAGTYFLRLRCDQITSLRVEISVDVDQNPGAHGSLPVISIVGGTTLADLRVRVADQLGDYWEVTATQSTSEAVITDEITLVEAESYFRGADVKVLSGHPDNAGLMRRVVSNHYANTSMQVHPPLPRPVNAGDRFAVFKRFRIPQYDRVINAAIRSAHPANRVPVYQDISAPYTHYGVGSIPIPDIFTHVYGIQYFDGNKWIDVDPALSNEQHNPGWWVDISTLTIGIGSWWGHSAHGRAVRILGYARSPELSNDAHRTNTDAEWLVLTAASNMLRSRAKNADLSMVGMFKNDADLLRAKLLTGSMPNTIKVRD